MLPIVLLGFTLYKLLTGIEVLAATASPPIFRNECADPKLNDCPITSICVDEFYGYSCQCKAGFLDRSPDIKENPGRICTPKDDDVAPVLTPKTVNQEVEREKENERNQAEADVQKDKGSKPTKDLDAAPSLDQIARDEGSVKSPKAKAHVKHRGKPKENPEEQQEIKEEENQADTSQAALRDTFNAFDTNKDGKINFHELRAATRTNNLSLSDAEVKRMLKTADKNNDGLVNFSEFQTLMKKNRRSA